MTKINDKYFWEKTDLKSLKMESFMCQNNNKVRAYSVDDQRTKVKYYLTYEASFQIRNRIANKEQAILYETFCADYQLLQDEIKNGILLDRHIVEYDKLLNMVERYELLQKEKEERENILENIFT
jgi:hypothetical protein